MVLCRQARTYRWIDITRLVKGQAGMYPKRHIEGWNAGEVPWATRIGREKEQEQEGGDKEEEVLIEL